MNCLSVVQFVDDRTAVAVEGYIKKAKSVDLSRFVAKNKLIFIELSKIIRDEFNMCKGRTATFDSYTFCFHLFRYFYSWNSLNSVECYKSIN